MNIKEFLIDIAKTPFSKYGSYLSVTRDEGFNRLTIYMFEEGLKRVKHIILNFQKMEKCWILNCRDSIRS